MWFDFVCQFGRERVSWYDVNRSVECEWGYNASNAQKWNAHIRMAQQRIGRLFICFANRQKTPTYLDLRLHLDVVQVETVTNPLGKITRDLISINLLWWVVCTLRFYSLLTASTFKHNGWGGQGTLVLNENCIDHDIHYKQVYTSIELGYGQTRHTGLRWFDPFRGKFCQCKHKRLERIACKQATRRRKMTIYALQCGYLEAKD